jgi:hypothetical protein
MERICAFAIKFKFAADIGLVVLHGPVVNRKVSTDLFTGFAGGDQPHNAELGGREIAGQGRVCWRASRQ